MGGIKKMSHREGRKEAKNGLGGRRTFTSLISKHSMYRSSNRRSAIASATSKPGGICKGYYIHNNQKGARGVQNKSGKRREKKREKQPSMDSPNMKACTKSAAFCSELLSGVSGLVLISTWGNTHRKPRRRRR